MNRILAAFIACCIPIRLSAEPSLSKRVAEYDAQFAARLRELQSVRVPLPDKTPYDSNRQARAKYLEGYAFGYRSFLTGITFGGGVRYRGQTLLEAAAAHGFNDGQLASQLRVNKQQNK